MIELFQLIEQYKEILPFLGAAVAALAGAFWAAIQFALSQRREREKREFDTFHKLVEDLVDGKGNNPKIDRQAAVVYELRFFTRYRPYTRRMLTKLRSYWIPHIGPENSLIDEIDLTLHALRRRWWHWE